MFVELALMVRAFVILLFFTLGVFDTVCFLCMLMVSPPSILCQKEKSHTLNQLTKKMLLRSIINRILIGFEQVFLIMVIIIIIMITKLLIIVITC